MNALSALATLACYRLWGLRGDGIHGVQIDYCGNSPPKLPDLHHLTFAEAHPVAIEFSDDLPPIIAADAASVDDEPQIHKFDDPALFAVANGLEDLDAEQFLLGQLQLDTKGYANIAGTGQQQPETTPETTPEQEERRKAANDDVAFGRAKKNDLELYSKYSEAKNNTERKAIKDEWKAAFRADKAVSVKEEPHFGN